MKHNRNDRATSHGASLQQYRHTHLLIKFELHDQRSEGAGQELFDVEVRDSPPRAAGKNLLFCIMTRHLR